MYKELENKAKSLLKKAIKKDFPQWAVLSIEEIIRSYRFHLDDIKSRPNRCNDVKLDKEYKVMVRQKSVTKIMIAIDILQDYLVHKHNQEWEASKH